MKEVVYTEHETKTINNIIDQIKDNLYKIYIKENGQLPYGTVMELLDNYKLSQNDQSEQFHMCGTQFNTHLREVVEY